MRTARMVALALALGACKSKSGPPSPPASASPPLPDAPLTTPPPASTTAPVASALPVSPTMISTEARGSATAIADKATHVVVGVDNGAVEIWAHEANDPHGDGSNIVGQRRDVHGARVGPPRLLRRTGGKVVGLAAARVAGEVWFGWTSQLANETTFSAVSRADVTLGKVAKPTTLLHTKTKEIFADGSTSNTSIRLAPRADGGGVLLATLANRGKTKCFLPAAGPSCDGLGWVVFTVSATGGAALVGADLLDGGPSVSIAALLDTGDSVFASAWTWHGGAVVHHVLFPSSPADAGQRSAAEVPAPRPPYRASWDGKAIVLHAPAHHWDPKRGACPRANEPELCEQVAVVRPPAASTFEPVKERRETCGNGHASITLVTAGTSAKLSTATGTVPELAGWTGNVLLDIDEDGHLVRRVCQNGSLGAPERAD